jgi:hypothetical protein
MSRVHRISRQSGRAVLAAAVVVVGLTTVSGPADATAKVPRISIALVSPAGGSSLDRYAASPVFRWQIQTGGSAKLYGSGRLEVSTTPTFSKRVTARFDCGYSPGDCMTQFHWGDQRPFWYDQADPCSDIPADGNCGVPAPSLYWRVRYQPVGGKSWSSPIGVMHFASPSDTTPPAANALPSTSAYGAPAVFHFKASDNRETVRDEVQLYAGGTAIFGARTEWDQVGSTPERLMYQPLPTTIQAGTYKWCLTVFDLADNQDTDCSTYTIT